MTCFTNGSNSYKDFTKKTVKLFFHFCAFFYGVSSYVIFSFVSLYNTSISYAFQNTTSSNSENQREAMPVNRIIIKYREENNLAMASQAGTMTQMQRVNNVAGKEMAYYRPMSGQGHVLAMPGRIPVDEAKEICSLLATLPEVEYAQPDYIMRPHAVPNDTEYGNQWNLQEPVPDRYGINAPFAWDITTGSSDIYIAVLDTGILDHADLRGRYIGGYDFITELHTSNDGDGRDNDPSDPGDWVPANYCSDSHLPINSSWHGTHVAGIIGAVANNGMGIAGVDWHGKIVPVRVLGQCGGSISDIADAIRWSAGLIVTGVPANRHPAKVINMSLGGYMDNGCADTPVFQNAINDAYVAGVTVVSSAGNAGADVHYHVPSSCNNVISVAATDKHGERAAYSNYGSLIKISAPGGYPTNPDGPIDPKDGILSTLNNGTTTPTTDAYKYEMGTSMAAPHVAGVVSLIYAIDDTLTPSEVLTYLQSTSTPFPGGSSCTTLNNCGAGIVNAAQAVLTIPPKQKASKMLLFSVPLYKKKSSKD